MFSLEKTKQENEKISGNKPFEVSGQPFIVETDKKENNTNNNISTNNNKVDFSPKIEALFLDKIINNDKQGEIKKAIEAANLMSRGELIYDTNILEYFKKSNPELYDLIKLWGEKEYSKSDSLIGKLIMLLNKYKGANEKIDYDLKRYATSFDDQEQYKKEYQKKINDIYIKITNSVLESEKQKNWLGKQVAGKNDFHTRKNNKTIKSIKNITRKNHM
jgi:hypothetical protein